MKILNDVKRFFHAKYLGFINFLSAQRLSLAEFLTTHLVQYTFNMVQRLDTLKSKKSESVVLQFVDFSFNKVCHLKETKSQNIEAITLQFVEFSADLMRNLVVLKGKNPDYVFPPPQVSKPLTVTEELEKALIEARARQTTAFAFSSWSQSDFKPENHPVIKIRESYEAKQKKTNAPDPIQVVVAPLPDPVSSVVIGQYEPTLDVKESDLLPVTEGASVSNVEAVVTPEATQTVED